MPDQEAIEPRSLKPSDVRVYRTQAAGALADDEAEAVMAYVRAIVCRRMLSPDAAANEASRLMVRFNDYYLDFRKRLGPHAAFLKAMHVL